MMAARRPMVTTVVVMIAMVAMAKAGTVRTVANGATVAGARAEARWWWC
jgi:hypothetical protein